MDRHTAVDIFGTFIAFVYLTPFIGGLLADRKLGYTKSIIIGGILMGIGYCGLAVKDLTVFYLSLALICVGNGFFKPNISTLLGNVYNDPSTVNAKTPAITSSTWGSISALSSVLSSPHIYVIISTGALPLSPPASACSSE